MESIEWHSECLTNQKKYVQKLKEILQRKVDEIERLEKQASFYSLQIKTAEKRKKFSFDRDRFMRKENSCENK